MVDVTTKNVLVSLYRGYGMGDAAQISAVLRHVRKYRPDWKIDFQAEQGRECVGRGIAHNIFSYGQPYPSNHYDEEVQMILYDTYHRYHDRPNTRVSSCLKERFGLDWDASLGRYEINVSDEVSEKVAEVTPRKTVAIHYRGDSAPMFKDLSHVQAAEICDMVTECSRYPLLLDWRNEWPTRYKSRTYTVGKYPFSGQWGNSPEHNCAVISRCDAFIGIDSGPAKCASATDTPTLVVWTGYHPALFHDPAPNTTHLVPLGFHWKSPIYGHEGTVKFFDENYKYICYDVNPIPEIKKWLQGVLK